MFLLGAVPFWLVVAKVDVVVVALPASSNSQMPLYDSQLKLFRQHSSCEV